MCQSLPCRVLEVNADGTAVVIERGRPRQVSLLAVDEPVCVDDWVLVSAGLAVCRVPADEATAMHALWAKVEGAP